jgi:hypothetical protein
MQDYWPWLTINTILTFCCRFFFSIDDQLEVKFHDGNVLLPVASKAIFSTDRILPFANHWTGMLYCSVRY